MKYIITENRLNKVIFNYLDMKFAGLEKRKGKLYDILFTHPNEEYGILGWKKTGSLGTSYGIINNISNMFGLDFPDSKKVIGEWVEDRHNLKVTNTHIKHSFG